MSDKTAGHRVAGERPDLAGSCDCGGFPNPAWGALSSQPVRANGAKSAEQAFRCMQDNRLGEKSCNSAVALTIVSAHGFPQSLEGSLDELDSQGIHVGC